MTDNNLVLICGASASGKSASLRNLKKPTGVAYLGCESGKALPFANTFMKASVLHPQQVLDSFDALESNDKVHTIIIDTLTFLMDMYESMCVLTMQNKMEGWSNYAQYFKELMQQKVASSSKNVIILAHTSTVHDEAASIMRTMVKVKGSLMNQGIESYFCHVISCKKMALTDLAAYNNPHLTYTDEETMLGYKYVYQTRLTKETVHEKIRGPMGLWSVEETFIDNDIQFVLDQLDGYYA